MAAAIRPAAHRLRRREQGPRPAERRHDEQVLLGPTGYMLGGCFACPSRLLKAVPFDQHFPGYIGSDDGVASVHWATLGIPMGTIENGPIARHLDWPYSEEKIRNVLR